MSYDKQTFVRLSLKYLDATILKYLEILTLALAHVAGSVSLQRMMWIDMAAVSARTR